MSDGQIDLTIKADSGQAVGQMRNLEKAANKAKEEAKKLEAQQKKMMDNAKKAGAFGGQMAGMGGGSALLMGAGPVGVGVAIAAGAVTAIDKMFTAIRDSAENVSQAFDDINKREAEKNKKLLEGSASVKGIGTVLAQSVLAKSGGSASDLNSIIEEFKKSNVALTESNLLLAITKIVEAKNSGINSDGLIKQGVKIGKEGGGLSHGLDAATSRLFNNGNVKTDTTLTQDNAYRDYTKPLSDISDQRRGLDSFYDDMDKMLARSGQTDARVNLKRLRETEGITPERAIESIRHSLKKGLLGNTWAHTKDFFQDNNAENGARGAEFSLRMLDELAQRKEFKIDAKQINLTQQRQNQDYKIDDGN